MSFSIESWSNTRIRRKIWITRTVIHRPLLINYLLITHFLRIGFRVSDAHRADNINFDCIFGQPRLNHQLVHVISQYRDQVIDLIFVRFSMTYGTPTDTKWIPVDRCRDAVNWWVLFISPVMLYLSIMQHRLAHTLEIS